MVDKGLHVTLVLDCCHSGGATRAASNDAAPRGVEFIDDTKRPPGDPSLAPKSMTRNVSLGQGVLPVPDGYTVLAACRPSESAYEAAFDGTERNGALTYWLLDALQQIGPELDVSLVYDRVLARIHSRFELQTPLLQGEADRVVFGVTTRTPGIRLPGDERRRPERSGAAPGRPGQRSVEGRPVRHLPRKCG